MNELRVAYPKLDVELIQKSSTQYCDDEGVSDQLVALTIEGTVMVDLFVTDCGRFYADPTKDYGVSLEHAKRVNDHNRISYHLPNAPERRTRIKM